MVMGSPGEHPDRIEQLRCLMERLSAPDLTLAEAKALRPRLSNLLETCPPAGESARLSSRSGLASLPEC